MKIKKILSVLEQPGGGDYQTDFVARQQTMVIFTVASIMIIILPLAVLGLTGANGSLPTVLNACNGLCAFLTFALYLLGYIKTSTGLCLLTGSMTIFTCAEMLVSLFFPCNFHNCDTLITGDIGLLMLVSFILVSSYMPKSAIAVSVLSMACFIVCIVISGSEDLENNVMVFAIVFLITNFLGVKMVQGVKKLHQENLTLKSEEQRIIEKLGLNKEQIVSLVQLSDKNVSSKERNEAALEFMETISPEARQRLITAVEDYVKEREANMHDLSQLFPELTPSEIAICRLVLQGKSTGEICAILDKTRGNVSSQRAHIRTKLGLSTEENLLEYLKAKVADPVQR